MAHQGKDDENKHEDGRQDESGENGPSSDLDLGSDEVSSEQTTCTQETGAEKKSESTDNVTRGVGPKEGDASGKSDSDTSLITEAKADRVLAARNEIINRATVEHHNTPFVGRHPNRGNDALKGSSNQVDGPQGVDKDLSNKNSDVEDEKNRHKHVEVTEIEVQDDSQEEDQRMSSLKGEDEVSEHDDIEQKGENCSVADKQFIDNCNFGSKGENEMQENTERMDNLKVKLFCSKLRGILSLFFNQEKYKKRMKIKEHDSEQKTVAKSLLPFAELNPMVDDINLYPAQINDTPIPQAAREEPYRLSSFAHSDIHQYFSVIWLARNGFFCNINNHIVCAFCRRYLRRNGPQEMLMGQFQNHRAQCIQHGNVCMESYGLNLADMMAEASNEHQQYVSGMTYQGQRDCTFVQQIRNNVLHNIAPSGSSSSGTCVLLSLPAPNLPTNEQDNGIVNAQQNQPAPLVLVHEEDNHTVSSSSNIPMIESVVHSLVNSYIGCELIESGFSHEEVEAAIRTLVRRGELVSIETVAEELMRNA